MNIENNNYQPIVHGPEYTMPKVLDYLQTEWYRYEVDRSHWVSEKMDLVSKITKLESEKRTQEMIKNDLFKRVKMLEYALHQERLKSNESYRLQYKDKDQQLSGNDNVNNNNIKQVNQDALQKKQIQANLTRDRIKKYLKSMNISDFIVSKPDRLNNGYGSNNSNGIDVQQQGYQGGQQSQFSTTSTTSTTSTQQQDDDDKQTTILNIPSINHKQKLLQEVESAMVDVPESLSDLANSLDSLHSDITDSSIDSSSSTNSFDLDSLKKQFSDHSSSIEPQQDSSSIISGGSVIDNQQQQQHSNSVIHSSNNNNSSSSSEPSYDSLNEDFFNKLSSNSKGRMKIKGLNNIKFTNDDDSNNGNGNTVKKKSGTITPVGSLSKRKGLTFDLSQLGAQDLNDIKLEDTSRGVATTDSASPRVWRYKHTLRSHLDGVRSVLFHPTDPLLISASDDHTIKVWNLNLLAPTTKKSAAGDGEPIATLRGHTGYIYTSALSPDGSKLYSGGADCLVRRWQVPAVDTDPYCGYGKATPFLECEMAGHTDAIWQVVSHPLSTNRVLSTSADGTVRVWDDGREVRRFATDNDVIPTTISVPLSDSHHLFIGYSDGALTLVDVESGQVVRQFRTGNATTSRNQQINRVVSHPLLPLAITGSEDNKIEFWDSVSGQAVHSMVAHSNSISSLAIDPSGIFLASASHDSSIRFWDISSKMCVQDLNSHRPKSGDSIHSISYHPTKGYFASGGADSVIRIHT